MNEKPNQIEKRNPTLAEQAARLSDAELQPHANVSVRNYHYCTTCFCCACLDELINRRHQPK